MQEFINYTFSGLTSAAIYAVAASGLVLTYTTTGVFNFAHGAVGMVAAFAYWQMRFGWHWPAPIAIGVCLFVLAPLFGALVEMGIMRRLEGTSETTKLVVTLSLLIGLLGLSLWVWDPNQSRPMNKFFEGHVVTILSVRLPWHQIIALGLAALVAIGLRLLLKRTRIGIAMRASVDDRQLTQLNGGNCDRVAMLAWAIGSSLAALSGVLIAPTLALSALPLTLLIINAYAAAMFGRLRSLPMTFVGALFLGLANDYSRGYISKLSTGKQYLSGFVDSVPVIVLFIVLLVLPQTRLRGHAAHRTREVAPRQSWAGTLWFCAAVIVGTMMVSSLLRQGDLVNVTKLFGLGLIALSLIPLVGMAGQLSLCQLTFAGIGAVVMAHIGNHGNPLALLAAGLITAVVGAIVALPSLRLSGIYLALSTAAFAVMMDRWVFLLPRFTVFGHDFSMFPSGSLTIARVRFFGMRLESPRAYLIFGSVMFALFSLLVVWIRRGTFGQRLLAMKDSPAACATLGLNLTTTKLAVFALSAGMAGVGGAVYGGALRTADPGVFQFFSGLPILLTMVIAGMSTLGGALATAVFLGAPVLANLFPHLAQLQLVLVGFAGVGIGQDPNGFIVKDIRPRWESVRRNPIAAVVVAAVVIIAFAVRKAGAINNWTFAIICLAMFALGPGLGMLLERRKAKAAASAAPAEETVPLELLGIARPFTEEDVVALDQVLNLQEAALHGVP